MIICYLINFTKILFNKSIKVIRKVKKNENILLIFRVKEKKIIIVEIVNNQSFINVDINKIKNIFKLFKNLLY